MQPPPASFSENHILAAVPHAARDAIASDFNLISLEPGAILEEQDEGAEDVFFPLRGIVSLAIVMQDGTQVEGAIVGREGAIGFRPPVREWVAPWRCAAQTSTRGLAMSAANLSRHMGSIPDLRRAMGLYESVLLAFMGQSIACNRLHTTRQRLARYLLGFHDRMGDAELPLTQEFLAGVFGVQRPTLTTAAGALRRTGAISYTRGRIAVLDRALLETASCECYARLRRRFDLLLVRPGDPPPAAASV